MASKAFGSRVPVKSHLVQGPGGLAGEVNDIRADVEAAMLSMEKRPTTSDYPELDWIDGAVAAAGGDIVLKGRNLLQNQDFASLALFATTSKLTFTALKPGADGNNLTIQITDTGACTVTKTLNAILITINLTVTTANDVATAVNANGAQTDGYLRCLSGGAGTALAVTAATHLAGGVGSGDFEVRVGGGAVALPANTPGTSGAAAITNSSAAMTFTAIAGAGAADMAQVTLRSNYVLAQPLSAVLS